MEKLFYTDKAAFDSSTSAVQYLLERYFQLPNARICKTQNGKPYLQGNPLYFSVTHSKDKLFIAFSSEPCGIDCEPLNRSVNYLPIIRTYPLEEQTEIRDINGFLHSWTARESYVKYIGERIAVKHKALGYFGGRLYDNGVEVDIPLTFLTVENHLLCVCSPLSFASATIEEFSMQ